MTLFTFQNCSPDLQAVYVRLADGTCGDQLQGRGRDYQAQRTSQVVLRAGVFCPQSPRAMALERSQSHTHSLGEADCAHLLGGR